MSDFADSFDVSNDDGGEDGSTYSDSAGSADTMTGDELAEGIFGDPGDTATDPGGDPAGDTQNLYDGAPDAAAPTSIEVNYEGTQFDAGTATFDSDGDGVADTAVQDHGYQVEYYVDNDGDGNADELTITDADGNLISHEQLVPGSDSDWQETPAPDTADGDMSVSADTGSTSSTSDDPSTTASSSNTPPGSAVPPGQSVPDGDMAVTIDGTTYDVGSASLDITGDGVADTVVVENGGNVEYYVDTDQDGVADQIIVLDEADGSLVNHEVFDPTSGTWADVTAESATN